MSLAEVLLSDIKLLFLNNLRKFYSYWCPNLYKEMCFFLKKCFNKATLYVMLLQHALNRGHSYSRCLILILELLWSRELQKMLKLMKTLQSYAYIKGKSSQWPPFIKAWKPHILLWCSPVPEEEQVCNLVKGLGAPPHPLSPSGVMGDHFAKHFPSPLFKHGQCF